MTQTELIRRKIPLYILMDEDIKVFLSLNMGGMYVLTSLVLYEIIHMQRHAQRNVTTFDDLRFKI